MPHKQIKYFISLPVKRLSQHIINDTIQILYIYFHYNIVSNDFLVQFYHIYIFIHHHYILLLHFLFYFISIYYFIFNLQSFQVDFIFFDRLLYFFVPDKNFIIKDHSLRFFINQMNQKRLVMQEIEYAMDLWRVFGMYAIFAELPYYFMILMQFSNENLQQSQYIYMYLEKIILIYHCFYIVFYVLKIIFVKRIILDHFYDLFFLTKRYSYSKFQQGQMFMINSTHLIKHYKS